MEFKKAGSITKLIDLYHGTKVVFNAFDDKANGRSHRVSETLYPRINVTLRKVEGF